MYDFDEVIDRHHTDCYKWDGLDKVYGDSTLIHLGCADMDFRAPEPVRAALREVIDHGIFGYTYTGCEFYQGIRLWYRKRHHLEISADAIVFTPRINFACGLCIEAFTHPGDKVVLNAPSYPPLKQAAEDNGRFVIEAPLVEEGDSYRFDLQALEAEIDERTRMLILVNPHNPTTRCWTLEELQDIAELCLRHNLILFADEIHCDFVRKGCAFHSVLELQGAICDRLILASSPAKAFNTMGTHAAYLIIPNPELRAGFVRQINRVGESSPNIFANAVMKAAYQQCAPYIDELNVYIDANEQYLRTEFARLFPALRVKRREGTFLLWLDFRQVFADESEMMDFFVRKAQVELYPGSHFGRQFTGFARVVLATSLLTLQEVVRRVEQALQETQPAAEINSAPAAGEGIGTA